jgi:UDP-N-acetylglucosamine 4-epimerase
MNNKEIKKKLTKKKYHWLITGVAGFIGSNLLEELLLNNQKVTGIDNLSNGFIDNLNDVKKKVTLSQWKNFKFIKADICDLKSNNRYLKKIDFTLHQAARGSVIKSIKDPIKTNKSNVTGFLNILNLSKKIGVKSFVYASSSSIYGDSKALPKVETNIGNLLSNYALTKKINEDYSKLFFKQYGFKTIGLRYFNVFGKRQDPNGDYAAVIPRWIKKVLKNKTIEIYGDGKTSRDFTPISDVVQANILSALKNLSKKNYVFNVGNGSRTSLNQLITKIYSILKISKSNQKLKYKPFRQGDIRHSLANIHQIRKKLNFKKSSTFDYSLKLTIKWFLKKNNIKNSKYILIFK